MLIFAQIDKCPGLVMPFAHISDNLPHSRGTTYRNIFEAACCGDVQGVKSFLDKDAAVSKIESFVKMQVALHSTERVRMAS